MPCRPMMMPPVGKSGPLTWPMSSSAEIDVLSQVGDRSRRRPLGGCAAGCWWPCPPRCPTQPLTSRLGNRDGKHDGLLARAVVVGDEVDRVHVEVAQHLGRHPRQARLRVPHGGRRVVIDRAEVALPVDERVAQGEVLRHADERVVDRRVAMGVEVAHDLADDLGALRRTTSSAAARARSSRGAPGGAPA